MMLLDLQIEVFRAKDILVPASGFVGLFRFFFEQHLGDLTRETGGGDNQALSILLQDAFIDTGPEVPALGIRDSCQLQQIVITGIIFRQE